VTDEPGWADREIRSTPFSWDAGGFPVVGPAYTPAVEVGAHGMAAPSLV
jgi:hypothetical protein